jgi:hypothetical protein
MILMTLTIFDGASFLLDNEVLFAIKHYRGHKPDTVTIYLDRKIMYVDEITRIITKIAENLDLPSDLIIWQRADDVRSMYA